VRRWLNTVFDGARSDGDKDDVLSYLINAKDPETGGAGMSEEELVAEVGVFLIAGKFTYSTSRIQTQVDIHTGLEFDTAALAITAAIFYLVQYPSALIKLRTELQQAFDSKESIRVGPSLLSCRAQSYHQGL
jgi:hypothetical protein